MQASRVRARVRAGSPLRRGSVDSGPRSSRDRPLRPRPGRRSPEPHRRSPLRDARSAAPTAHFAGGRRLGCSADQVSNRIPNHVCLHQSINVWPGSQTVATLGWAAGNHWIGMPLRASRTSFEDSCRDTARADHALISLSLYIYIYIHIYMCICISLSLYVYIYIYIPPGGDRLQQPTRADGGEVHLRPRLGLYVLLLLLLLLLGTVFYC